MVESRSFEKNCRLRLENVFYDRTDEKVLSTQNNYPLVSIIIPCRNEENFIGRCLDSILANDYPPDRMEILVIDGMSDDRTRTIVAEYTVRWPLIRCLDNPSRRTPFALNVGISEARGDYLARIDAHAEIAPDYLSECVKNLEYWGADNVGGVMKTIPRNDTLIGRGIISVLSHRFGVGGSAFRTDSKEPQWVDTVFGGFYPRNVFHKVGLFNEGLWRGQDMEFNRRLTMMGGKILLCPQIRSYYHARTDYRTFVRHNFSNGVWAILPIIHSTVFPVSFRHLVPLIFVVWIIAVAGLWLWAPLAIAVLATVPLFVYGLISLGASLNIFFKWGEPAYILVAPFLFITLHVTYGAGSLLGVFILCGHYIERLFSDRHTRASL